MMPTDWINATTQRFDFQEPPDMVEDLLEFRLIYEGTLPSESRSDSRPKWKQHIRQQLHPQLQELWKQDKHLMGYEKTLFGKTGGTYLEQIANSFQRGNHRFVPLITDASGYWCSLNVLVLRRDVPGNLIRYSGDMDNRLKVLFDALAIPSKSDGLSSEPAAEEDPLYCLLEDDRLITSLTVITDRLLIPQKEGGKEGDVKLVIHVQTSAFVAPPVSSFVP